jgi:hypothetical protein
MRPRPLTRDELSGLKKTLKYDEATGFEKVIGKWTHYILLSNGVRWGVDLHTYPFKPEHWKYFHPNTEDGIV